LREAALAAISVSARRPSARLLSWLERDWAGGDGGLQGAVVTGYSRRDLGRSMNSDCCWKSPAARQAATFLEGDTRRDVWRAFRRQAGMHLTPDTHKAARAAHRRVDEILFDSLQNRGSAL